MGERITIRFVRDGDIPSTAAYLHWAGPYALNVACDVIKTGASDRPGVMMANFVYEWCRQHGGQQDLGIYLDEQPCDGSDWGNWTYDIEADVWTCKSEYCPRLNSIAVSNETLSITDIETLIIEGTEE
jgi:hypothetical protein